DIDLLIIATFTPDFQCPSTACLVQDRLGIDVPAFDLNAACAGFMYAATTAGQYIATGNSKLALVIGADCNSRIVDQTDRSIAPLFGDGAGAVIMAPGSLEQGFKSYQLGSDGGRATALDRPAGGTKNPITAEAIANGDHFLRMDGKSVFKWAVRTVAESIEIVLESAQMSVHDVSLFVLHQANQRILDAVGTKLGIPKERMYCNLQKYGNTSAASIPLALDEAVVEGLIEKNDTILMSGFGAGLTWGTSLFVW
ncbi:MAG: beta-ketoacyl-ACP synthase 3, partial [Planctomycetaceae bacterium]|nr:beta-ketoacyl-ACP synthase 3 [Planctomycetaceae bacterium]